MVAAIRGAIPVASASKAAAGTAIVQVAAPSAEAEAVSEACVGCYAALAECGDERQCGLAQMSLKMCIAKQVCQQQAEAFEAMKGSDQVEAAVARFEAVEGCLSEWACNQKSKPY